MEKVFIVVHAIKIAQNCTVYLSHPNMRMPEQGKYYSVNEAYRDTCTGRYQKYIDRRLLNEANPVAFLAHQAGGTAIDGTRRVLGNQPEGIRQRTPLVVGSRVELADFERFVVSSASRKAEAFA